MCCEDRSADVLCQWTKGTSGQSRPLSLSIRCASFQVVDDKPDPEMNLATYLRDKRTCLSFLTLRSLCSNQCFSEPKGHEDGVLARPMRPMYRYGIEIRSGCFEGQVKTCTSVRAMVPF